ncbi:MAG: hypothetical protein F6J93_36330 [Oscillatoria sp. SIO1A7]|nr:hypothetical protein [Oscillatoria sp. SIO1A7]
MKITLHQVKKKGLNKDSLLIFENRIKNIELRKRCEDFKEQIIKYLKFETNKINPGDSLLASSDILESILGKYKMFS